MHGVEGLNRSAAVIMAFLMSSTTCLLDDVFIYIQSLRPHLQLDDETLECLLKWETSIFGTSLTLIDELWTWKVFEDLQMDTNPEHYRNIRKILTKPNNIYSWENPRFFFEIHPHIWDYMMLQAILR